MSLCSLHSNFSKKIVYVTKMFKFWRQIKVATKFPTDRCRRILFTSLTLTVMRSSLVRKIYAKGRFKL